jgi:hypothetical protein
VRGGGDLSPKARTREEALVADSPEALLLGDADDLGQNSAVTTGGTSQGVSGAAPGARVEAPESQRAMALLALLGALDPVSKAGLASILGFKTKVVN